jgi:L-threonylcarbamoyladenylate synthase
LSAEILRVHPDEPQPERIEYIVSCLRRATWWRCLRTRFYGLAVDPVNLHAVEQIYQIKSRQKHKPLSLLIASVAQAYELARDIDDRFDRLAERSGPGR